MRASVAQLRCALGGGRGLKSAVGQRSARLSPTSRGTSSIFATTLRRGSRALGDTLAGGSRPLPQQVAQQALRGRGIGTHARRYPFRHHLAAIGDRHGLAGSRGAHLLAEAPLEGLDADAVHEQQ